MANYRPMSLLTVFSKLFKKAMHSKLSHRLHTDNILVTELCGSNKGVSTENPAFRLTDSVFYFYRCTVHFEDHLVSHQLMHYYSIY